MHIQPQGLLTPDVIDRHGPSWKKGKITSIAATMITDGVNYFQKRTKFMTKDLDKAGTIVEEAVTRFGEKLDIFMALEQKFSEAARKSSGNVRDATTKLAEGLAKIERTANFDRLEHYVNLLERAEKSLSALAELEKGGRLDRIASALR